MFEGVKRNWKLSKIGASIEGVVRCANHGDGAGVKNWYADYLRYSAEFAAESGLSQGRIDIEAGRFTKAKNLPAFREIEFRLTKPGKLLDEVKKAFGSGTA